MIASRSQNREFKVTQTVTLSGVRVTTTKAARHSVRRKRWSLCTIITSKRLPHVRHKVEYELSSLAERQLYSQVLKLLLNLKRGKGSLHIRPGTKFMHVIYKYHYWFELTKIVALFCKGMKDLESGPHLFNNESMVAGGSRLFRVGPCYMRRGRLSPKLTEPKPN